MYFFLSKTLYFFLMPVTWIVLAFLLCLVVKKYQKQFFFLGLFFLLVFSNPFLGNSLMRWWEVDPVPVASLPQYRVGIVLGGLTSDREPRDRVHVIGAADRVLEAIHLYRLGKIKKILLSGGSGKLIKDSLSEAFLLKRILQQSKVPDRDILMEPNSRNTHENAVNSALLLKNQFPGEKYLLITSAYHMRRAKACFLKAGVAVDIFPVDERSDPLSFTPDVMLVPTAGAMGQWEIVIREMVGMAIYKITGYI